MNQQSVVQSSSRRIGTAICFFIYALLELICGMYYEDLVYVIAAIGVGIFVLFPKRNVLPSIFLLVMVLVEAYVSGRYLFYWGTVNAYLIEMLLQVLGLTVLAVISFIAVKKTVGRVAYLPALLRIVETLWLLVGALFNVDTLVSHIRWGNFSSLFYDLTPILSSVVLAIAFLLYASVLTDTKAKKPALPGDGHFDMVVHILLLLLLGGIWQCIWICRTTKYLNICEDEKHRDPLVALLLCMFVPFYFIYWTYKSAQRIDKMAAAKGISSDIATLCLILAFFIGIVPPILMQSKLNAVCTAAAPVAPAASTANNASAAEEIKKYKDLLDAGAITEEEYEAKKKQLLGL